MNAAVNACDYLPVKAIVCSSLTGLLARACSATRKHVPIAVVGMVLFLFAWNARADGYGQIADKDSDK